MASSTQRSSGSKPKADAPDTTRDSASPDRTNDTKQRIREETQAAVDTAREQVDAGKQRAGQHADHLAEAASAMASSLDEQDMQGLASLAQNLSDSLGGLANRLQHRSLEELIGDARDLARNNPSMFLFGSVAVGFGLSRFLKASEPEESNRSRERNMSSDAASKIEVDLGTADSDVESTVPSDEVAPSTGADESMRYNAGGDDE